MALPDVLRDAPEYWGPAAPPPSPIPSCQLVCYQPVRQCQTYWCWAAVLQELIRCLRGKRFSQCLIADLFLPIKCCCSHMADCNPCVQSPCNTTAELENLITPLWRPQMTSVGNLSACALCAALEKDRPVIARFSDGNANHYAVFSGLLDLCRDLILQGKEHLHP